MIIFFIFTALGGGEEDLLKQSSLGPTLTCQMTKSKLITARPAHSGVLQWDIPSEKPVHSSQTSGSLLINLVRLAHPFAAVKLLLLVFKLLL